MSDSNNHISIRAIRQITYHNGHSYITKTFSAFLYWYTSFDFGHTTCPLLSVAIFCKACKNLHINFTNTLIFSLLLCHRKHIRLVTSLVDYVHLGEDLKCDRIVSIVSNVQMAEVLPICSNGPDKLGSLDSGSHDSQYNTD